jgi:hypothetical protein
MGSRMRISLTKKRTFSTVLILATAGLVLATLLSGVHDAAATQCGGTTAVQLPPGSGEDLEVTGGTCTVPAGTYNYGNVNIYNGGTLFFQDAPIDFYAASILVENTGSLIAGMDPKLTTIVPIGTVGRRTVSVNGQKVMTNSGVLVIHLYGADQGRHGVGIVCKTDATTCGAPTSIGSVTDPGGVTDIFYPYTPLPYDDGKNGQNQQGFFGYKVLAVSYGGTLKLYGLKGACYDGLTGNTCQNSAVDVPSYTGTSWVRLAASVLGTTTTSHADTALTLSSPVDWSAGDEIALTSTDYLPGHAEDLTIQSGAMGGTTTSVKLTTPVQFNHDGVQYPLNLPAGIGPTKPGGTDPLPAMESRAAVALLSRSIVIQSEGAKTKGADKLPDAFGPTDYFGGHTIVRQGFMAFQMQGVEFKQLGQGGKIAHYPVHFHMVRQTPMNTFVKDCSVNESMTRWYVLHATQGITLQRDVGYLSIGHGYYLEEGTETDNKLYGNIGIFARAAVNNKQNTRKVPGILAAPDYGCCLPPPNPPNTPIPKTSDVVPYHSDWDHPSLFWIMNGWNDFQYNMAAGAGTCGVCYWLLPGGISGMSQMEKWESYAGEQTEGREGTSPLQNFVGNSCSGAMASFVTVGNSAPCLGAFIGPNPNDTKTTIYPVLNPVDNPLAPKVNATEPDENGFTSANFYPVIGGGGRFPTACPATGDCSKVEMCSGENEANCLITAIDHYTTSFNWPQTNFAAIWLRPQWYLFINSIISDVQNGGITFVTGGGYTASDTIPGHWALARKDAFIGNTQATKKTNDPKKPWNPFASNAGPFNPDSKLACLNANDGAPVGNYCLSKDDGISFALDNFATNQRLFSIYDGPAYEDSNLYKDITTTTLTGCKPSLDPVKFDNNNCLTNAFSNAHMPGVPYDAVKKVCYSPNAAIAWKQPNGFYYPPAFHSQNLSFSNVDIRHFVIEPVFFGPGTGDMPQMATGPDKNVCPSTYPLLQTGGLCCPNNTVLDTTVSPPLCVGQRLFQTDRVATQQKYCTFNDSTFQGFTDVDRQTELDDDDATLTGLKKTISVNQDHFFDAPLATPECLSDIGVTPQNVKTKPSDYPGTATTSPYEYVTTVEFPKCAAGPGEGANRCGGPGAWSQVCSTPSCFGVPVYRENRLMLESPTQPTLIRLMGQATYQRSSLTVNNGTYYIDTSPSASAQLKPAIVDLNVFKAGETYYTFLLFAKPTTKQTYDIYVGANDDEHFGPDNVLTQGSVFLTRVTLPSAYNFMDGGTWPWDKPKYNATTGVLTVTMDMSKVANFQTNYNTTRMEHCQPISFCKWTGDVNTGSCGCNDDEEAQKLGYPFPNSVATECKATTANAKTICSWASTDVDCPAGGCYGFGVKLSNNFKTTDKPPDPAPSLGCFSGSAWATPPFVSTTNKTDDCYYNKENLPLEQMTCAP